MRKHYNLFWVIVTMKLQNVVELSLILILASNSKGQKWGVYVNRSIKAELGSNVTILCKFEYPSEQHTKNVVLYWKTPTKSKFNTYDKDPNAYVFHPNNTFVVEKYRGRTMLIGNKTDGNCTLKIINIMENVTNVYLRIIAKSDNYSFVANSVTIALAGSDFIPKPSQTTDITNSTFEPPENPGMEMYLAIFVPISAVLIIIFVTVILFFCIHKRSKPFTREESGYYANCSRVPSNQAKRKELFKKQDNKDLPELKAIGEPVYINMEAPAGHMDQRMNQNMDHTDNVYANVNCST